MSGFSYIEGGFQCELKWSTLAASTEWAILIVWFQNEEEKLTGLRATVVSNPSHDRK